ncbi:MAG: DUF2029 domain-containing protein [Hyphomonas sp.]|nr:DUF2029 domain-containing protein [Hyphomonas sp.]
MKLSKVLHVSNAWLSAPSVLPRLQRLSIIYGVLYFGLVFALTWISADLNYGSSGVVGGDFLAFYTAGDMTQQGRALDAYQFDAFDAALQTRVANEHLGMMWQYPPLMFFLVGLLALMPYKVALWVWIAGTAAIFVLALSRISRAILPDRSQQQMAAMLILASPLCLMVVISGQISLLTAALLMMAAFRPKRDWLLAGLAAGLLTVKPQLGVLLPLAYIFAGAWRAFGVAAVAAILLHSISILVFGPESIEAFLNAIVRLQSDVAGSGTHTPPENMTTLFGQLRFWEVPARLAMPLHVLLSICVLVAVTASWWRFASDDGRALFLAAITGAGAILVTPYAYAYEMAALAPAALWLAFASQRFRSVSIVILAAASGLLVLRQSLPLDALIQIPFLVSALAFVLLMLDATRRPNVASTAS